MILKMITSIAIMGMITKTIKFISEYEDFTRIKTIITSFKG